jgi:hypothetical protein
MTKDEAKEVIVSADEIIILSSGVHSDYEHYGIYCVLKELNKTVLEQEYALLKEKSQSLFVSAFVDWLIERGYVMPVDYIELYLGEYKNLEPELR